jgi:hypothetical protein
MMTRENYDYSGIMHGVMNIPIPEGEALETYREKANTYFKQAIDSGLISPDAQPIIDHFLQYLTLDRKRARKALEKLLETGFTSGIYPGVENATKSVRQEVLKRDRGYEQ